LILSQIKNKKRKTQRASEKTQQVMSAILNSVNACKRYYHILSKKRKKIV
jgi:hypothetical protein